MTTRKPKNKKILYILEGLESSTTKNGRIYPAIQYCDYIAENSSYNFSIRNVPVKCETISHRYL